MKNKQIRTIYGIVFLLYTAALGVLTAVKALTLHFSGGYTVDGVAEKLQELSLFALLWAALIVGGAVIHALFPVEKSKPKAKLDAATQLKRMAAKLPEGAFDKGARKLETQMIVLWSVTGVLLAAIFFFPLCYLLNPAHFNYTDTNTEMVQAATHTLPFVGAAFAVVIAAYLVRAYFLKAALAEVKNLTIAAAKEGTLVKTAETGVRETWLDNPKVLWAVRIALIAVALFFVIFGIANGGMNEVFKKAAELCTECVGLA